MKKIKDFFYLNSGLILATISAAVAIFAVFSDYNISIKILILFGAFVIFFFATVVEPKYFKDRKKR